MNIDPKLVAELSKRQVIVYLDEDGGYFVDCPSLPGCHSQGDTWEETLVNIREAIELWIEDALEHNESIPEDRIS
jgi:predicted RNase H-like HicB family nuclease